MLVLCKLISVDGYSFLIVINLMFTEPHNDSDEYMYNNNEHLLCASVHPKKMAQRHNNANQYQKLYDTTRQ